MFKEIDISSWDRKDVFTFFSSFENPNYSLTVDCKLGNCLSFAKAQGISFFHLALYGILQSANSVPAFRQRLVDGLVREYEHVSISCTVPDQSQSFRFAYFPYRENLSSFVEEARQPVEPHTVGDESQEMRLDNLHCSFLPWLSFTSFTNAQKSIRNEGIPKIVLGKYGERAGVLSVPLAVEVNHALVDGLHIGQFVERLEGYFLGF